MATGTDRKDLERFIEERDYFAFILDAIEGSDDEEDILQEKVLRVMISAKNRIIDCAQNNKPFIAAYFCNAPELFSAMDIPWYMLMETAFLNASAPHILGESDKSVRLVKTAFPERLPYSETYFNENAVEVGWVDKSKLLLWDRLLMKEDLPLKVIIDSKSIYAIDHRKPTRILSGSNGLFVYNLYKQEENSLLVSAFHRITLTSSDLFWVHINTANILKSRNAYSPDWQKVLEGSTAKLYSSREAAVLNDTNGLLWSASEVIPHAGFPVDIENPADGKVINYIEEPFGPGYIDRNNDLFLKTVLVDAIEITSLTDLLERILEARNKEEFRRLIGDFFYKENVTNLESKTIAELLKNITGIDFISARNVQRKMIQDISNRDFLSIQMEIQELYEKMASIEYISNYEFFSGVGYYWLPEDLLALDLIGGLILSGLDPVITRSTFRKETYEELDIFYFDNSDVKSLGYKDAELKTIYRNLSGLIKKDQTKFGHILYYSDGVDPIIGEGENDMEQISSSIRQSNTSRPAKFFDKIQLEKHVFERIESVSSSINFHFFVSNNFYQKAMEERKYILEETVQRITRYVGGERVKTTVFLYQFVTRGTAANNSNQDNTGSWRIDPDNFQKIENIIYTCQPFSN